MSQYDYNQMLYCLIYIMHNGIHRFDNILRIISIATIKSVNMGFRPLYYDLYSYMTEPYDIYSFNFLCPKNTYKFLLDLAHTESYTTGLENLIEVKKDALWDMYISNNSKLNSIPFDVDIKMCSYYLKDKDLNIDNICLNFSKVHLSALNYAINMYYLLCIQHNYLLEENN